MERMIEMPKDNDIITKADLENEEIAAKANDVIDALINTPDETTKEVSMPRFNAVFVVRAIDSKEYNQLSKRCEYPVKNKRTHKVTMEVDDEKLAKLLIYTACKTPKWDDPQLKQKYNTDDPCEIIDRRLYIGEITILSQAIMDVSGFSDEVEVLKN